MTNKEFLLEVQKSCHIEMPRCLMLMGCLQKMLGNAAVDQVPVVLSGLGVFTSHKHPEYVQEHPQTGAMTLFPPRITYHIQSEQSVEGTPCANLLAEYAHTELDEASLFVDALVLTINNYLKEGEEIDVPGIGTFKNVLTHQSDLQHVDYLPCDQMKELVNAPFSCFEPFEISSGTMPVVVPVAEEETKDEPVEPEESAQPEEPVIVEEPIADEPVLEEPPAEPVVSAVSPAPKIMVQKDGHIVIQDSDDNTDKSNNLVLWISLSLIMIGCAFLVWLMFDVDSRIWDDPPTEAKVVETIQPKAAPASAMPDSIVNKETQAPAEKKVTAQEETSIEKEEKQVDTPAVMSAESPAKIEPAKIEPAKTEPAKVEPAKPIKDEPSKPVATQGFHRLKDANGKEVTVTLQAGSRLTLIALEHFGDKSFWPYIFDVNTDKLKAPNLVQSGMVLYLPDPNFYGIDANDPASVRKAKNRAAQLLK